MFLWSVIALLCPGPRPRNAAATRTAILDAARERFAAESYDDVGMRDIARDVGLMACGVWAGLFPRSPLSTDTRLFGDPIDIPTEELEESTA